MGAETLDGAGVAPQDKDEKKKKLIAKIIEINFKSQIDLHEKKKKIKPPHWKFRRKKIKPACYTRKSGGGKKDLEVKIKITELENISGNATLVGEVSGIKIKSESFSLKKGKIGPIKCKLEDLPDTLYYYNKEIITWKIEHGSDKYSLINNSPVILFIIFNKPAKPWTATGSKSIWVEALKFLFTKVGVNNYKSKKSCIGTINRYLHSSYGLKYDTISGRGRYCNLSGTILSIAAEFNLTNYLKRTKKIVNCYDQAAGVTVLSAVVGIGAKFWFMDPFGYINTTNLIGIGSCNNPFYNNPTYSNKKIWITGDPKPRSPFGNHAFGNYSSRIYDACAGPDVGTRTPKKYIKNSIDHSPSFVHAAGKESDIYKSVSYNVL